MTQVQAPSRPLSPRLSEALEAGRARLSTEVPAQSLAVFRMAFGALVFWDVWRFVAYDRLWRYWIQPEFHFSYAGFHWLPRIGEPWVQIAWAALGLAALCVALGLFYRIAIAAMTLIFTYFFLYDAAEYLNHFYLVILYAVLLCFLPAARIWSLDAWRARRRGRSEGETVPYAAVFALRAQTEIMLIYAGLVKITPDWLAGEPLGLWLRDQADGLWIEPLLRQDWIIVAACWSVIALHVLGAPLLLWARTRLAVFLIYCVFHVANSFFFNIGIFPWLTIAATTIFFAPHWPSLFAARFGGATPALAAAPAPDVVRRPVSGAVLAALTLWMGVQIALPVRGGAFDSEIRWSGEGHRFSWRMRIFDRQAEGRFIVADRETGEEWIVDPDLLLTWRQTDKMLVRADMVHQFAGHLADLWRAEGREVSVRAEICKSLNGRPCQNFVDPAVDLTQVSVNPFGSDSWVLPLEKPVWGVADNAAPKPRPHEPPAAQPQPAADSAERAAAADG